MANLYALYHDRIKVNSTDTGTGALTIDTTEAGYLPLPSADFYYVIEHENGTEWEVGFGDGNIPGELNRATVVASSNSDALVNFSVGAKRIFTAVPAEFFNAVRDAMFIKQARPSGEVNVSTSGATPVVGSSDFYPALSTIGGASHKIATYTVSAKAPSPNHRKLWEGKIVIVDGTIASSTQGVLADPNSRSWSFTVDESLDFTVTGEAGVDVDWHVAIEVLDYAGNGI